MGINEVRERKTLRGGERLDSWHGEHRVAPANCRRGPPPRRSTAVNDPRDRRFEGGALCASLTACAAWQARAPGNCARPHRTGGRRPAVHRDCEEPR
jgi:hypothetical protein